MAKKIKSVEMGDEVKTAAEAAEAAALPEAYAVRVGPDGKARAEHKKIDLKPGQKNYSEKTAAEWAYERVVMYIKNFEEQLDADHEVGMGFAAGDVGSLKIQGMGYFAPDLITFYGEDPTGSKMQLIQHVSQLNVMLVAEKKTSDDDTAPNRIGFQLAQDLENAESI